MEYHTGTVVFGDWVIVEKIGEGASGQVFKIQKTIERNNSKTYVYSALKVIRIPRSASDVYEVRNASTDEKSVTEYFQKYVDQLKISKFIHKNILWFYIPVYQSSVSCKSQRSTYIPSKL